LRRERLGRIIHRLPPGTGNWPRGGRIVRRLCLGGLVATLATALACASAVALSVPPGFQARNLPLPKATSAGSWVDGLQLPTTVDFDRDGHMFVAERNGRVLEFDSVEDPTPTLVASLLDDVLAVGDRGILGMKLDPEFPQRPYLYLSYTYDAPIGGDSALSTHPHNADGTDSCEDVSPYTDCVGSGRLVRLELDPATFVAVGGAQNPDQEVMVNSWCVQFFSHSIGDLEFDEDGALLMSGGEGASWSANDYGQFSNPCGDPPDEGGALRSQDVGTPATASDPTDYSGSIIRVDPDTGATLADNPFSLSPIFNSAHEADVRAQRIIAFGFRNPYRFTLRPGTDEIYVGDVGQDFWEEIDRVASPPPAAVNFGWPCFEGGSSGNVVMFGWLAIEKPLCQALYANPSQVRAPFFAYSHSQNPGHDGRLFAGDACDPLPGSAIAGLAFYDPSGVPAEDAFPAQDAGALFFADAARGCIWTMQAGPGGVPDPATLANFALREAGDPSFTPVDVVEGPDGALYVPNFYEDAITQVRYFPGNQPPSVALDVDHRWGKTPLHVKFDASATSDPDAGDALHYAWDLDGDGEFDDGADQPIVERTYNSSSNVTARLRVSDEFHHVDIREAKLYPGDLGPPVVTIQQPDVDLEWAIGEQLNYAASATDPDGDSFGAGTLTPHWQFTFEHCPATCHEHPLSSADSTAGSFTIPGHDYPSHLKLEFTATDARGLSASKAVEVFPRLIELELRSEPAGIPLTLDDVTAPAPFKGIQIAGGTSGVAAPASAEIGGRHYAFSGWSDGGARIHDVTSLESRSLVARYMAAPGGDGGPSAGATGRLRLASRPRGVGLRVGSLRRVAPFAASLPRGARTFILAPRWIRRQGQLLRFQRWASSGHTVGSAPRRAVTVSGDSRYVAVYGSG
jgi:glucose/arabinose dehydrogenase